MKTLLCPCEDITLQEVEDAVHHGYRTLEDVKRFTGVATGSCQGRLCLPATINVLCRLTGETPPQTGLITFRPPLEPVPLGLLAAGARPPEEQR